MIVILGDEHVFQFEVEPSGSSPKISPQVLAVISVNSQLQMSAVTSWKHDQKLRLITDGLARLSFGCHKPILTYLKTTTAMELNSAGVHLS